MGTIIKDESRVTIGAWVTIAETRFYGEFAKLLIHVFETVEAQSIQYRIQASNDEDFDGVETLTDSLGNAAWTITAGASDFQTVCDCWGWVRVQVADLLPGTHGTARCIISGSN